MDKIAVLFGVILALAVPVNSADAFTLKKQKLQIPKPVPPKVSRPKSQTNNSASNASNTARPGTLAVGQSNQPVTAQKQQGNRPTVVQGSKTPAARPGTLVIGQ